MSGDERVSRSFRILPSILKILDEVADPLGKGAYSQIVEEALIARLKIDRAEQRLPKADSDCVEQVKRLFRDGEPKTVRQLREEVAGLVELDELRKAHKHR